MNEESDDDTPLPPELMPEEREPWPDSFVLTASQDWDILLHRLSNGVRIGQFAQDDLWNIKDMYPYQGVRPRYVREWLAIKKEVWMNLMEKRLLNASKSGLVPKMPEESKSDVKFCAGTR